MVNQNIYKMKQPELGKKIFESRKAKGLTQEELVEKCNLNVRTIQRIEAGDVTPRSHTIKTLFEVLEIEWNGEEINIAPDEIKVEKPLIEDRNLEKIKLSMPFLYLALFAGVINFMLKFFEDGVQLNPLKVDEVNVTFFWAAKIGVTVLFSLFLIGLIKMTHVFPNKILRGTFWAFLIANSIFVVIELALGVNISLWILGFYMIRTIAFGAFFLLIGVGFLSYKNIWSNYTKIIGVLGIISGTLIMSVIGNYIVTVPLTLFKAGLLAFLFWGITKIGRTSSPDSTFSSQVIA